ncbi:MAG: hypothetical protein QNJ51_16300 [Calothrix sp. MO_167.B12]|nr:hypothetical protein [Calothrix sp. MO_167.B12]
MHPKYLIIEASWDDMSIKYILSINLLKNALIMYVSNTEKLQTDWLNSIYQNPLRDYLEISLSPSLFAQISGQTISTLPHQLIQTEITDPSILHLAYLLRTEMETPKILSKEFVFAIVTAMIMACEISNQV